MSAPRDAAQGGLGRKVLDFFSSYALVCVILLLLFLLTFLGTIEQTEQGLFDVQKKYFESVVLVHWLGGKLPIPLPGAYLLLALLAVNLVCGGLVRIRKSRQTIGVIVIHAGMLLMLAAGLVKMHFSDDGHLTLFERERSDEYVSYHEWEVAIFDGAQARDVKEWVIPFEAFTDLEYDPKKQSAPPARTFSHPDLPFRLTLSRFERNCQPLPKGPNWESPHPLVDGFALRELPQEKENEANTAGLYAKVETPDGAPAQEAILWGRQRYPLTVRAGGRTWGVDLRKKRFSLPFTIVLDEFTRVLHPGTGMAKSFESDVTKVEGGTEQQVKIQMNEPLRHKGYVLFQASWGPGDARPGDPLFSTFAVVRNPSDYWPLYSCIIITIGLLIAFGDKLRRYVQAQAKKREADAA